MDLNSFLDLVQSHVDGTASKDQEALLAADTKAWVAGLLRLLDEATIRAENARRTLRGRVRSTVVTDFESEIRRIDEILTGLIGPAVNKTVGSETDGTPTGLAQLQVSWSKDNVVVWASGRDAEAESVDELYTRLDVTGSEGIEWSAYEGIKVAGQKVPALSAPLETCLGWLGSLANPEDDYELAPSARWMGLVTALAVRSVALGRAVPHVHKHRKRRNEDLPKGSSRFEVRWIPALVSARQVAELTRALPSAVIATDPTTDRSGVVMAVATDITSAIFAEAAEKIRVADSMDEPQSAIEVSESILSRLDGEPFVAPGAVAGDIARKLDGWSAPLVKPRKSRLVVQLDPPDSSDAWYLQVLALSSDKKLQPCEQVIVNSSTTRSKEVEQDLERLERLYPELLRPGARRRGEVILSQEEAWELMSSKGHTLSAAGYEVRTPEFTKGKPAPTLKLNSEAAGDSVVGAQQLSDISWSVMFEDLELDAEQIRELARDARPLIENNGKWVELDQLDLQKAAAALEERKDITKLTGADMLRHALGLEGSTLSGGVSLAGDGWAADLLRSASSLSDNVSTTLEGFEGELRSYQAEARTWLSFLDSAGLGGCLALDMGLGKTPTMLAHIRVERGDNPTLVIAPPAVVSNWASEAKKFTPGLITKIHHGPNRASGAGLTKFVKNSDLIITTYGTAVRDMDALSKVVWDKVVLDEAQAIKNPASETAKQLRRLDAKSRVALTGTPIENGLGDLWSIMDFVNPGLVGDRSSFIAQLSVDEDGKASPESTLSALNGILVFRRTKAEPAIAAELPDRIDELDQCFMTPEQIGLYQAVLDSLVVEASDSDEPKRKGAVLAAITALKQICNHPAAYDKSDSEPLDGRSGKLARLDEIIETVFSSGERLLVFTHFASWGEKLADYLTATHGVPIPCYHGGLSRGVRDKMVDHFQKGTGPGAMVVSLKAGGTGLNLTAANHVVLYDRWWNPAVEDQARDRVWRIGQKNTVVCHRLVCPGTVDERVEEVVAGKRRVADLVLPKSSSVGDLNADQLQQALGLDADLLLTDSEELEAVGE